MTRFFLIVFFVLCFPILTEPPLQPTRETAFVIVKPSLIPHSGEGVFAKKKIPQGMLIGSYLGTYLTMEEARELYKKNEHHYFFGTPECAKKTDTPYIDGIREHYTSKVNFAPQKINGKEIHLINVHFKKFCKEPYVRLFASRDIEPGEELYVSYGPDYEYFFMKDPEVIQFFLNKADLKLEKLEDFQFEP
jgi:SET domain-containing protein